LFGLERGFLAEEVKNTITMRGKQFQIIGIIKSPFQSRDDAQHQGKDEISEIVIDVKFEAGLKDIEKFSHLSIFYLFRKSEEFSLSVTTPWDTEKHGLFATRSPNRPSKLGYAVVQLIERKGNFLSVKGLDAIDGTPIVDIKPYIPRLDARPFANQGWFEDRKLPYTPRIYEWHTETMWKEGKEGVLSDSQKHDIQVGCPPEFGGEPVYWSAEHLFISSVEVCIMTTFLDLVVKHNLKLKAYRSTAIGRAQLVGGDFKFKHVEVNPVVVIDEHESAETIRDFLAKAKEKCMVSNSLSIVVHFNPQVRRE